MYAKLVGMCHPDPNNFGFLIQFHGNELTILMDQ